MVIWPLSHWVPHMDSNNFQEIYKHWKLTYEYIHFHEHKPKSKFIENKNSKLKFHLNLPTDLLHFNNFSKNFLIDALKASHSSVLDRPQNTFEFHETSEIDPEWVRNKFPMTYLMMNCDHWLRIDWFSSWYTQ